MKAKSKKLIIIVGFMIVAIITISIVVAVTTNSEESKTIEKMKENPILSYYGITDGIDVKWAHAVNSKYGVKKSINDDSVMFLEADVVFDPINNIPIMAHPPATTSDITLKEWLSLVFTTKKGAKIDVKQGKIMASSVGIIMNAVKTMPSYIAPILLNADILQGPNNNVTKPVDANDFIKYFTPIKNAILSPGWTTGFTNESSGYTWEHVHKMSSLMRTTEQFVTFPIRASLASLSEEQLIWLIKQDMERYSLTVWTTKSDTYSVKSLSFLRKYKKNVFYDLPENEIEELKLYK